MASVTTISGTPDTLITWPTSPLSTANPVMTASATTITTAMGCSSINRAANTLLSSSSAPKERSMPPAITMIPCPMAR
ncbi:MAG: hypothetical protein R2856_11680 [Caldilineaceae bacterium]